MRKLFVYFLWTLLFVTVISIAGAFYAIDKGWIGYMPPIEDLQNPINRFATQIYSADGKIIGTWNYNRENRVMVDYSNLPPSLVQFYSSWTCCRQAWFAWPEECRWRLYHYTTVG